MIHDFRIQDGQFAMTANHVISFDRPIVFRPDVSACAERDMPSAGTTTTVRGLACCAALRCEDPFGEVRWAEIEPCYVFHVANAYDTTDGKGIVLQAVRYPELWRNRGPDVDLDHRPRGGSRE